MLVFSALCALYDVVASPVAEHRNQRQRGTGYARR